MPGKGARVAAITFARRQGGALPYRLDVAGRALAAVLGGFVLASAAASALAAALVAGGLQPRGMAVGSGTLVSWIVWTGAAMWAFHAPSQGRAWGWLLGPAAALGAVALALGLEG